MTQKEAIERLAKWLGDQQWLATGDVLIPIGASPKREYLRMLSEQAAAFGESPGCGTVEETADLAREQVHALIEMLEV